jgi:hypothetical protein
MREISTQALRAFKDENTGAIEVVKSSMQRAVEALRRELPPDFPKGQIGDLRRCQGWGRGFESPRPLQIKQEVGPEGAVRSVER